VVVAVLFCCDGAAAVIGCCGSCGGGCGAGVVDIGSVFGSTLFFTIGSLTELVVTFVVKDFL
jgi:hypothetical protein